MSVVAVSAHLVDTRTYRANVLFDNICRSCRRRVHPPASSRPRQRVKLSVSVMALSEVTSPDPSDRAVRDYVLGGPLIDQLSISRENATDDVVDRWTSVAARLCDQLSMELASLDPAQASRVYRYYLPVYLWCLARLEAHRSVSAPGVACPALGRRPKRPAGLARPRSSPSSPDCSTPTASRRIRVHRRRVPDGRGTGGAGEQKPRPTRCCGSGATPGPTTSSWACARSSR